MNTHKIFKLGYCLEEQTRGFYYFSDDIVFPKSGDYLPQQQNGNV